MTLEEDIPATDFWQPLSQALAPQGVTLHRWRPIPGVVSSETPAQHAWFLQLTELYPKADVRFEAFTLELPDGTFYSPSLTVIQEPGRQVIGVYEVHGTRPEDRRSYAGFLKARAAIPTWDFQYVRRTRQGWIISRDQEDTFSTPETVSKKAKPKRSPEPAGRQRSR